MQCSLGDLVITDVISVTSFWGNKDLKGGRTQRAAWGIILKHEGETDYFCNGKKYLSNFENILILPRGCSYEWHCKESGRCYIIEFMSESTMEQIVAFHSIDGNYFLKVFNEMEYKRMQHSELFKLESIRDTYSVLISLLNTHREYSPSQQSIKLQPALDYMFKNYNTAIRNDQLAQLTGYSTVHFRKLFAKVYGTSPIDFIRKLRINKAKEMLRTDYGSITDIARSLGYSSICDFSRDFRKQTGMPPSKFK